VAGHGNIYTGAPALAPSDKPIGDSERRLDSRQYGLFVSDRITFNEQWQTVSAPAKCAWTRRPGRKRRCRPPYPAVQLLPNAALIYKPQADTTLYASYQGLSVAARRRGSPATPPRSSRRPCRASWKWASSTTGRA
jgi:iron complex outermembrane receptor protein